MQNIEEDDGDDTLFSQLSVLHDMIKRNADSALPTIVFGDLNIPASVPNHYRELVTRLGQPSDLWVVAGNPVASGSTFVRDNNFYEDPDDRPNRDERLDYILLKRGNRVVPTMQGIEVLSIRHNGRLISDHLGVMARFAEALLIDG